MTAFAILMLILAVGFVVLAVKRKSGNQAQKLPPQQNPFAAVSIVFDDSTACPEVMKLSGQRLLSREAPPLPLPNCSAKKCTCSFHYFSDRRKGPRRADDTGIFEAPYKGPERREESRGRRAKDTFSGYEPRPEPQGEKDPHADTYFDFHKKTGAF